MSNIFNTFAETGLEGKKVQRFAFQQDANKQAIDQWNQIDRQLEKKQKEINALIIKTRDNNIPLIERQEMVGKTGLSEGDFPCPPNFGMFTVSNWGWVGGCGFEIFDKDGNKYWIDINPIYNLMKAVKEGPDYAIKQRNLNLIPEEKRTPEALFAIFPDGYKTSADTGNLIMPKGGAKKKSKKSRKTRKTNKKSKRKNKSSKKNRLLKRKKYTRKHA